jgi:hypothetical protein
MTKTLKKRYKTTDSHHLSKQMHQEGKESERSR